jgi:hypothetical protein
MYTPVLYDRITFSYCGGCFNIQRTYIIENVTYGGEDQYKEASGWPKVNCCPFDVRKEVCSDINQEFVSQEAAGFLEYIV